MYCNKHMGDTSVRLVINVFHDKHALRCQCKNVNEFGSKCVCR